MNCRICGTPATPAFSTEVLRKYLVQYFQCPHCGFVQTEEPYWLGESYARPINLADTGILTRNLQFAKLTSVLLFFLFDKQGKYLDFAGGYGIFTRLMRDIGFDYYWQDPHTPNLVARGFEYAPGQTVNALTAFEVFEHFVDPKTELQAMLSLSRNIIFSTLLLPSTLPGPDDWWYYGREHGQHVSLYTRKSLTILAESSGLHFNSNGRDFHMMSERPVSPGVFSMLLYLATHGLMSLVRRGMTSKTVDDMMLFRDQAHNPSSGTSTVHRL